MIFCSTGNDRGEDCQPDERRDDGLQLPRGLLQLVPHPPRRPHHHRAHRVPLSADHHRLVPGPVLQVSVIPKTVRAKVTFSGR